MKRLDDLQIKGYKIYQDSGYFCFGIDAVILANFVTKLIKKDGKYIDLCSGNGIIPILIEAKNALNDISLVEIDNNCCKLARESLQYNHLSMNIINDDIKNLSVSFYDSFDYVSVNPPYFKVEDGLFNKEEKKSIARHEILCDIYDVCHISKKLLKEKGSLFMVHRPNRLEDVMYALKSEELSLKEIMFIYPKEKKEANLFCFRATRGKNSFAKVLEPLIIYDKDNNYTKEYLDYIDGSSKKW